jgi:hypothetical protein
MGGPVYIMNRLVHLLGDSVQRRVTGILRDDDNIRAFLFELQIATHFFRRGYDIQFADLKNLGNYDLLVSDGSLEIEIECKRKSVDAGRRIPRFSLYMLTDMLLARFENFSDHILVTVTSGARLQANQAQLSDLANQIHEAFKKDMTSRSLGQVTFTIERLALTGAIKNDEDAARVLSPYWSDGAHFAISSNREHTLVLKCQGVKRDEVLTAIYEELKGAADQLSKTRPALIACFIEELDDSAWGRLAEKSGLQVMTHKLFGQS